MPIFTNLSNSLIEYMPKNPDGTLKREKYSIPPGTKHRPDDADDFRAQYGSICSEAQDTEEAPKVAPMPEPPGIPRTFPAPKTEG